MISSKNRISLLYLSTLGQLCVPVWKHNGGDLASDVRLLHPALLLRNQKVSNMPPALFLESSDRHKIENCLSSTVWLVNISCNFRALKRFLFSILVGALSRWTPHSCELYSDTGRHWERKSMARWYWMRLILYNEKEDRILQILDLFRRAIIKVNLNAKKIAFNEAWTSFYLGLWNWGWLENL